MAARRGRAAALLGGVVVVLASCASTDHGSPGAHSPDSGTRASAPPTSSATTTHAAEAVATGQPVEVVLEDGTLELVLEDVEVATTCPGRAAPTQAPAFGYFVILQVTAAFSGDGSYAPTSAEMYSLATSEGASQAVSTTDASWACFEDDELLPPFVDDGDTVTGRVVLDSRTDHGRVTYGPLEESDWFWSF